MNLEKKVTDRLGEPSEEKIASEMHWIECIMFAKRCMSINANPDLMI